MAASRAWVRTSRPGRPTPARAPGRRARRFRPSWTGAAREGPQQAEELLVEARDWVAGREPRWPLLVEASDAGRLQAEWKVSASPRSTRCMGLVKRARRVHRRRSASPAASSPTGYVDGDGRQPGPGDARVAASTAPRVVPVGRAAESKDVLALLTPATRSRTSTATRSRSSPPTSASATRSSHALAAASTRRAATSTKTDALVARHPIRPRPTRSGGRLPRLQGRDSRREAGFKRRQTQERIAVPAHAGGRPRAGQGRSRRSRRSRSSQKHEGAARGARQAACKYALHRHLQHEALPLSVSARAVRRLSTPCRTRWTAAPHCVKPRSGTTSSPSRCASSATGKLAKHLDAWDADHQPSSTAQERST